MFWKRFNPLMIVVTLMVIVLAGSIISVTWRHNDWALQITLAALQLCGLLTGYLIALRADETSKQSLNAALESNKLDRELHRAEMRPWVVATRLIPNSDLDLTGGLRISWSFEAQNVGNSIASNITYKAVMHLGGISTIASDYERLRLEALRDQPHFFDVNVGHLLVPGEKKIIHTVSATIHKPTIDDICEGPHGPAVKLQGLNLFIHGIIMYAMAGENTVYETGFRFRLQRVSPSSFDNPSGRRGVYPGEVIPASELALDQFGAGNYAK